MNLRKLSQKGKLDPVSALDDDEPSAFHQQRNGKSVGRDSSAVEDAMQSYGPAFVWDRSHYYLHPLTGKSYLSLPHTHDLPAPNDGG